MKRIVMTCALVLIAGSSFSQPHQPYASLQSRTVKALSEQQVADLRAGRGMSLALPAELNGYPGPLHVIELADVLALTPDQLARMRSLYDEMKSKAMRIGERLIDQEEALDHEFASHSVTASTLHEATAAIGKTQSELRASHLRYHLLTVEVLTHDQMQKYAEARGYRAGDVGKSHRGHPQ
jgi:hypothetical protein